MYNLREVSINKLNEIPSVSEESIPYRLVFIETHYI